MHAKYYLLIALALLTVGCYRMPDENHISRIPLTNNPHVVPQRDGILPPGMAY